MILQGSVKQNLHGTPSDKFSYIEVGQTLKKTYYRFSGLLQVKQATLRISFSFHEATLANPGAVFQREVNSAAGFNLSTALSASLFVFVRS